MYREVTIAGLMSLACYSNSVFAIHAVELPVELASASATLTNHTARIVLDSSTPGFDWSLNCIDLSVIDSATNPIDFFVQSCDVINQQAIVWVEVPSIPASPSSVNITLRYNDPSAVSLSSAVDTFDDEGFLFHTQPFFNPAPGPESRTEGDSIFNYDSVTTTAGYGCTQLAGANVNNSGVFGSNADIAYRLQTVLNVLVPGNYEFRYGNDYDHGGEMALDGIPIESDWTDNLWWGFNYSHPDVLTGTVTLSTQAYTLDALGFESCCDGSAGLQFRQLPAGAWANLDTANTQIELLAPDCPLYEHRVLTTEHRTGVELELTKTASDLNPSKGETITFLLTIKNSGPFDANNVEVADAIPVGFMGITNISHSGVLVGNLLQWTIVTVPTGDEVTLSFDAVVQ